MSHLALVRFLEPATQPDQAALLQGCEVSQVALNVVSIQFFCYTDTHSTHLKTHTHNDNNNYSSGATHKQAEVITLRLVVSGLF